MWETMRSIAMCSVTNTPGLLELMSLQEHVGILQEHEINVCLLSHLPDEELRLIGISKVLHRKKLKAGATLCCLTSSS